MKAKEALAKIHSDTLEKTKIYEFILTPCNEGQSMNFLETCKGNVQDLFVRCNNIVEGLKSLFPSGDFSVLIENQTFDDYISFISAVGVLDKNGNLLLKFNDSK
jgi:hypothetical protein